MSRIVGVVVLVIGCALAAGLVAGYLLCRRLVVPRAIAVTRAEFTEHARRDHVTGLASRAQFVAEVSEHLEQALRTGAQPVMFKVSLDRFKHLNDSLGHAGANQLLATIAGRLTEAAAATGGHAARVGGDDFAIIESDPTGSDEDAIRRAESLLHAVRAPIAIGELMVFVTASVGVAVCPRGRTIDAAEMIRRADIATNRAKLAGRDRVAKFDDAMQAEIAARMDVETALHGAVGRQEMRLYHQPIVDIRTGELTGFESLLRWERGPGKITPPSDFIPVAEENGIISELGAWALHESLRSLRRWIDEGLAAPTTTMSVNVSPRQIADPRFAAEVRDALAAANLPAESLWLEITETMMVEEPERAERTLREIHDLGVRIALDDFGTGYSSLSLLQRFPIGRIKIDRAFVNGIADRAHDRSLVRTIISMAQSMTLDLVAEGIETVEQLELLREYGCGKAQGYLISRPVPEQAIGTTIAAMDELSAVFRNDPVSAL